MKKKLQESDRVAKASSERLRDPELKKELAEARADSKLNKAAYEMAVVSAKDYKNKADNAWTSFGSRRANKQRKEAEKEAERLEKNQLRVDARLDEITATIAQMNYEKIEAQNDFSKLSADYIRRYSQEEYDKIFK